MRGWVRGAMLALAVGLPAALPPDGQAALALARAPVLAGEVWRLWTGHFVHFGGWHAGVDGLAWVVVSLYVQARVGWRTWAVALLAAAPLLSGVILLLEPGLHEYRGASGLVLGQVAWSWVEAWRAGRVARGPWMVLGAGLLLKLLWDLGGRGLAVLPAGVALAWSAHVGGAVIGVLLGVVPRCVRRAPDPRT